MPHHFGDLDANVVLTPALTSAVSEVRCALDGLGIAIFHGAPGTGKDFAVAYAREQLERTDGIRLQFAHAPRELELCEAWLAALDEEAHQQERSSTQLDRIAGLQREQRRPVYIPEAQHWSRGGFGALRQVFDQSGEAFPIILSGSEDFEHKLRRYGCLGRRAIAGQHFKPMTLEATLEHVPRFHRLYASAAPEAIGIVNAAVCRGRWGHWASFTRRALILKPGATTLTVPLARQLVGAIRHSR